MQKMVGLFLLLKIREPKNCEKKQKQNAVKDET